MPATELAEHGFGHLSDALSASCCFSISTIKGR
jgi:hypothetical protein